MLNASIISLQCFCFEEQRLNPHEEVDMPVFFYIDPEFDEDPRMARVDTITLSYTFFEAKEGQKLPLPGYSHNWDSRPQRVIPNTRCLYRLWEQTGNKSRSIPECFLRQNWLSWLVLKLSCEEVRFHEAVGFISIQLMSADRIFFFSKWKSNINRLTYLNLVYHVTSVNAGILVQLPMLKCLEERRKRMIYENSIKESAIKAWRNKGFYI